MRVLVTGHNGYIGSVMLPVLKAAGHTLGGLDTYFFEDCTLTTDLPTVPPTHMDIRDVRVGDFEGVDAVIHLAAVPDHPQKGYSDESIADINHHGAVQLADRARESGVRRFLYASSCSVYGAGTGDETFAEDAALRPATPEATATARAEAEIVQLADASFSPVIMRIATAYGVSPRLRADIVLNNLICWAHTTGRVHVPRDAAAWRSLVHVEDIAHAFAAALVAPREAIHGHVFNVGSDGENYQLSELTEIALAAVPGSTVEYVPDSGPPRPSCRMSFSKLGRTLHQFRPRWNAVFGCKDLYVALQEGGVTHEQVQERYTRAARLRRLMESGRVDRHLRWSSPLFAGQPL